MNELKCVHKFFAQQNSNKSLQTLREKKITTVNNGVETFLTAWDRRLRSKTDAMYAWIHTYNTYNTYMLTNADSH